MRTIEEYEVEAKSILDRRYGIDRGIKLDPSLLIAQQSYFTSEITETITQLMLIDFNKEQIANTQLLRSQIEKGVYDALVSALQFDSEGAIKVSNQ